MGLIYITGGKRLFGRVDRVPGMFCVATEFVHPWYCPMVPLRSVIIVCQSTTGWQGVATSFSWKSILLAWSLPILLLTWTLGGTIAVVLLTDHHTEFADKAIATSITCGAFILWLVLLVLPTRLRARYVRAKQLGTQLGLTPEGWARLERCYE